MNDNIRFNLVVARAQNGVIGSDNQLPWRLPNDLAYFKKVTMGNPILMGRKTFESIGRPLPGRRNIVLTHSKQWNAIGVDVVHSLGEVNTLLADHHQKIELMVIGGEQIYRLCMPFAERLFVTEVYADVPGDAHFPAFDERDWQVQSSERYSADERNPYSYAFVVFERRAAAEPAKI